MGLPIKQDGKACLIFFIHAALLLLKIKEVKENRITTALVLLGGRKTQNCYCTCSPRLQSSSIFNSWKSISRRRTLCTQSIFLAGFCQDARAPLRGEVQEQRAAVTHSPTAPRCPPCAAIMSGVLPARSAAFTRALWLSSSCRHSTRSAKAAACRGVLGSNTHSDTEGQRPNTPKILHMQEAFPMVVAQIS